MSKSKKTFANESSWVIEELSPVCSPPSLYLNSQISPSSCPSPALRHRVLKSLNVAAGRVEEHWCVRISAVAVKLALITLSFFQVACRDESPHDLINNATFSMSIWGSYTTFGYVHQCHSLLLVFPIQMDSIGHIFALLHIFGPFGCYSTFWHNSTRKS